MTLNHQEASFILRISFLSERWRAGLAVYYYSSFYEKLNVSNRADLLVQDFCIMFSGRQDEVNFEYPSENVGRSTLTPTENRNTMFQLKNPKRIRISLKNEYGLSS